MAPYWLVRLNDFLAWLNPTLCIVAGVLAAMVIAAAAGHSSGSAANPTIQAVYSVNAPSSAECPQAILSPELRDLRLYD
jgi:hypothetical protein